MNRFLFVFPFLMGAWLSTSAQTSITSDITSNTTWTVAGSPYLLQPTGPNPITVISGVTLIIEPGVVIRGSEFNPFNVQGTLQAIGTSTDSILFESPSLGSFWYGFSATGDAGSIQLSYARLEDVDFAFDSITNLTLKHCQINPVNACVMNSGFPFPGSSVAAQILIEDCQIGSPTFSPFNHAVYLSENIILRNSILYNSGLGACTNGLIEGCRIFSNVGAVLEGCTSITIQDNTLASLGHFAIDADLLIVNNWILDDIGGGTGFILDDPLSMSPNIIQGNQFQLFDGNGNQGFILFNTSAAVSQVDLSGNCWFTTDTTEITPLFDIYTPNPNPTLPSIILSPLDSSCIPNKVYPGDANYNQIANVWDLLPIGINFGTNGPIRPNASLDWVGQEAPDWPDTLLNGANLKHVDCDGDGLIGLPDVQAIIQNYGSTHNSQKTSSTTGGTPLYTDPLPASLFPGDTLEFLIYLGKMDSLAEDVYGLAFGMSYDTSIVKPGGITVEFDITWLGSEGVNLLSLAYDDFENGRIEIAQVRTDQMDTTGFGAIARTIVVLDDDISKKEIDMILRFEEVQAIGADEEDIPLNSQNAATVVITSAEDLHINIPIKVYPNPAHDFIHIESDKDPVQSVRLYNISGQLLYEERRTKMVLDIPVQNIATGLYVLEVQTEAGILREKVWISR